MFDLKWFDLKILIGWIIFIVGITGYNYFDNDRWIGMVLSIFGASWISWNIGYDDGLNRRK